MNRFAPFMLAAACAALSVPAAAQFAKPEDAIKYRQSAMFLQSQHFGRIAAMATGRAPYDAAAAVANADVVAVIAKLPWSGAYAAGTEGGKAAPEIWQQPAKFKELSDKLVDETGKLAVAAKSNNLDAIKASVAAVGETCKSCHDTFRKR